MTVVFNMSVEPLSVVSHGRIGGRPPRLPPRNEEGEIVCTHDECKEDQPTFKRLCEFNKHMDKHERPYKCSNPACRKNPGFTYAGGLLRHQREVHNMHRTKEPFFCPHTSCNRSAGSGFSRRENLEEHMRRRHSGISIDDNTSSSPTTSDARSMRPLEPLPDDRKRRAETAFNAITITDATERGSDHNESQLKAHIALLQQENERIRAELYRKDRLLAELSQDNERLRGLVQTMPPPPPHTHTHVVYQPSHPPPLG